MKTFVAICAKNGQRVSISIVRDSIDIARNELHNQGYSIIDIKETESQKSDTEQSGTLFYFDVVVDGKKKSGQIRSADTFKAYLKLVEDLHFQVESIYDDPNATQEEKHFITTKIKQTYDIYRFQNKKESEEDLKGKTKKAENEMDSGSILAKQVARYHVLIEKIILKITNILTVHDAVLDDDRKYRLKELIAALKQLKNITNPDKLKMVGEAALVNIGKLELELISSGHITEKKDALYETNRLLQGVGSSNKIILPEDDFVAMMKVFWKETVENYFTKITPPSKAVRTTGSSSQGSAELRAATTEFQYYKNVRELNAYKEKGKEIAKELRSGFFSIPKEKKTRLNLKLKLIGQNAELLENRIKNRSSSYVKIKRGISFYSESFFFLIRSFWDLLIYVVFSYFLVSSLFNTFAPLLGAPQFAHKFIFALTLFSFAGFLLKQVRSWISTFLSSFFLVAFIIAITVNFSVFS